MCQGGTLGMGEGREREDWGQPLPPCRKRITFPWTLTQQTPGWAIQNTQHERRKLDGGGMLLLGLQTEKASGLMTVMKTCFLSASQILGSRAPIIDCGGYGLRVQGEGGPGKWLGTPVCDAHGDCQEAGSRGAARLPVGLAAAPAGALIHQAGFQIFMCYDLQVLSTTTLLETPTLVSEHSDWENIWFASGNWIWGRKCQSLSW